MIGGSLFAGFIYTVDSKLPFWFAALSFGLAALVSAVSYRAYRAVEGEKAEQPVR